MFGQKKAERTHEDWLAERLQLAEATIPKLREDDALELARFQEELRLDRDAYKIRVEKFGTALALFIEGRACINYGQRDILKACHTVNLIASPNTISLKDGHGPDMNGVKWCTTNNFSGGASAFHWSLRDYQYSYGEQPGGDSFLRLDPKSETMHWGGVQFSGDLNLSVKDCARPSEIDRIRFEGAGATLQIPFGLGAGVYQQILAALAQT